MVRIMVYNNDKHMVQFTDSLSLLMNKGHRGGVFSDLSTVASFLKII